VLARPRPVARASTTTRPRTTSCSRTCWYRLRLSPARAEAAGAPGHARFSVREAGKRQRHQTLARYQVGAREDRGDRLPAHPEPSPVEQLHAIVGFRRSVRGVGKLDSRPATDLELLLLPRSPSAAPTAGQGVEAVKGQVPGRHGCPRGRAPGCRSLKPSRSPPQSHQAPRGAARQSWARCRWSTN
jgi:hypothetical protein